MVIPFRSVQTSASLVTIPSYLVFDSLHTQRTKLVDRMRIELTTRTLQMSVAALAHAGPKLVDIIVALDGGL